MPTFEDIEVTTPDGEEVTASFQFEVFCAECGEGMCNNATVRMSRRRYMPQITITPCQKCLDAAHDRGVELGEQQV